jgi:TatD DNase family protein
MTAGELPVLDAHAHIPGDVTPGQITALGDAAVFAMTMSLQEAVRVRDRRDPTIVWGVGLHPREATARDG